MNAAAAPLTLGEAARRLGVELWMLQALLRRGLGPSLSRVGPYRVVSETDLAPLADALRAAGYLPRLTGEARPAIAASGARAERHTGIQASHNSDILRSSGSFET